MSDWASGQIKVNLKATSRVDWAELKRAWLKRSLTRLPQGEIMHTGYHHVIAVVSDDIWLNADGHYVKPYFDSEIHPAQGCDTAGGWG